MSGNFVIVKLFGGHLAVRKVWSVGQTVVYVTDEKNYDLLTDGRGGTVPVGVPKEDVFEYTDNINLGEAAASDLKRWPN